LALLALGVAGLKVLPCVCRAQFAVAACHAGGEGAGSAPDTRVNGAGGEGRRVGAHCTFRTGGCVVGWLESPGPTLRTLPRACIICVGSVAGLADTIQLASGSGAARCGGCFWTCQTRLMTDHSRLGIVGVGRALVAYIL